MREIKFRAWDGAEMYQHEFFNYAALSPHYNFHKEFITETTLMQYTGLHDKNGVEIYEGDIVQYNTGEIWFVEWVQRYAGFSYVNKIIADESGRKKPSGIGYAQIPGGHECEVIGNIYSNPELIKETS